MSPEEWLADQIEVVVSGFFTTHHQLQMAAEVLAELTLSARREAYLRTADGRALTIRRRSWWKEEYELRDGPDLLASARPRGAFRREIVVQFGDQQLALRPAGFWNRGWFLVDASESVLLEVKSRGFFQRGALLGIREAMDIALVAFTYFLVHQRWQAEAAAAAGAS